MSVEKLRSQIADGTFPAGSRLPSTRSLAVELGVSRTTVTAVYEQLAAEGYLETSQRAKARVAPGVTPANAAPRKDDQRPREARTLSAFGRRLAGFSIPAWLDIQRPPLDFLYGSLASTDSPTLAWRKAYSKALLQRQARLSYADPQGEPELRTQLRGYLRRARGLFCDPDQIVIVHGSQQGIDLCARVLIDPGDRVVIEDPCYGMARLAFEAAGATLLDVPVDEQGLVTDRLPSVGIDPISRLYADDKEHRRHNCAGDSRVREPHARANRARRADIESSRPWCGAGGPASALILRSWPVGDRRGLPSVASPRGYTSLCSAISKRIVI